MKHDVVIEIIIIIYKYCKIERFNNLIGLNNTCMCNKEILEKAKLLGKHFNFFLQQFVFCF